MKIRKKQQIKTNKFLYLKLHVQYKDIKILMSLSINIRVFLSLHFLVPVTKAQNAYISLLILTR